MPEKIVGSPIQIFISYSHTDTDIVDPLKRYLAPWEEKGEISVWYDKKVLAGEEVFKEIDTHLISAEVVVLCLSSEFLYSRACKAEMEYAEKASNETGVAVIHVVLRPCLWQKIESVKNRLLLPTDGKPVVDFSDKSQGFQSVSVGLERVIERVEKRRGLRFLPNFFDEMNDAGLISICCPPKKKIKLDDIYVPPLLVMHQVEKKEERHVKADDLVEQIRDKRKIIIEGEEQSGKTALVKKLIVSLKRENFIPVLIKPKTNGRHESIAEQIEKIFSSQYEGCSYADIDKERIVLVFDDFDLVKEKSELLNAVDSYRYVVLIIDEYFFMNIDNERNTSAYTTYRIKAYTASQRYELIKKWLNIQENGVDSERVDGFKHIDQLQAHVTTVLGKVLGRGVVPAYPFYILSIVSVIEDVQTPHIDQEITSQGYCYQALLFLALRNCKVKNDEVDTYINFLAVVAFEIYSKGHDLDSEEYKNFIDNYRRTYNLHFDEKRLLDVLRKANIFYQDSCGLYSFPYRYLKYYFIAKYIAEHYKECTEVIQDILNNLHQSENAYVAVFITHHTKEKKFVEGLCETANEIFKGTAVCSLRALDVEFFNKQVHEIVSAVMPSNNETIYTNRKKQLDLQQREEEEISEEPDVRNGINVELIRALRTSEVLGQVLKNRAGSFEVKTLMSLMDTVIAVYGRLLTQFFEYIRDPQSQEVISDFIFRRLSEVVKDDTDVKKRRDLAHKIFWNLNFLMILGVIRKASQSIGSSKLLNVIDGLAGEKGVGNEVLENKTKPLYRILKHTVDMFHGKKLVTNVIKADMEEFPEIVKRLMKHIVVGYCSTHPVDVRKRQEVEAKLGLDSNTFRNFIESEHR